MYIKPKQTTGGGGRVGGCEGGWAEIRRVTNRVLKFFNNKQWNKQLEQDTYEQAR